MESPGDNPGPGEARIALSPRRADPRATDPPMMDPRATDPRAEDPKGTDPRAEDPRWADPRPAVAVAVADEGLDLADLIETLWRSKFVLAAAVLAALALAVAYLNVATYRYAAELRATPAPGGQSALGSSLRGLGGLASLAGVDLPQDSGAVNFLRYAENLHSRSTAEALLAEESLIRRLFAEEWDAATGRWAEPAPGLGARVRRLLGLPVVAWRPPDGPRVQAFLRRHVSVERDLRDPLVTVGFRHADPQLATDLLATLHRLVDEDLRARSLQRATANVAYLREQLATTTVLEHRVALSAALGEQERVRMMAQSRAGAFAAEPVAEVSISAAPVSPRPMLVLAGAIVAGGGLAALVVLVLGWLRQRRQARRLQIP